VRGLRRREPAIDLVTVHEAGLGGRLDPEVLEWSARAGRVLIAQDKQTLIGHAWNRVTTNLPMPGLIVRNELTVTIRQAIDELLVVACCGLVDDFKDQVIYLPL
jgi:hypothetical protein